MKSKLTLAILTLFSCLARAQTFTPEQYRQDFNYFWSAISDEYCYFSKKQTDWEKVKQLYTPMADTVSSRASFVSLLEKTLYELYDHHCNLNTNNPVSRRLVPTSADVWAEYINGKPVITEVRMNTGAERSGIKAGMEIIGINGKPVNEAVEEWRLKALKKNDTEADAFTLRLLLAGDHVTPRRLTLTANGVTADYYPDENNMDGSPAYGEGMVKTAIAGNTGYIRINNCLYDNTLIHVFDSVMQQMKNTRALILDLRETPSGGNTSVARAILGWFINKAHFYQQHEYYAEEKQTGIKRSWQEIVSPRPGKYYSKPLVILVNHWTGSIAEGITIGFDSFKRPRTAIIGTSMARLNGAVYSYQLPNTRIGFSFTAERLYHINGQPREAFVPGRYLDITRLNAKEGEDVFMTAALEYINRVAK